MTKDIVRVRLPTDIIEKVQGWANRLVAHYRSGEHPHTMPWTRDLMTINNFRAWVANRAEAGRAINIETCELGWWYAHDADPYGLREAEGTLPHAMKQVGRNRFVRSPESNGWVCEDDLPKAKFEALYARLERERSPMP